jgi:hypothetical protein
MESDILAGRLAIYAHGTRSLKRCKFQENFHKRVFSFFLVGISVLSLFNRFCNSAVRSALPSVCPYA